MILNQLKVNKVISSVCVLGNLIKYDIHSLLAWKYEKQTDISYSSFVRVSVKDSIGK